MFVIVSNHTINDKHVGRRRDERTNAAKLSQNVIMMRISRGTTWVKKGPRMS